MLNLYCKIIILLSFLTILTSCTSVVYFSSRTIEKPVSDAIGFKEVGFASYYSDEFIGKRTSSGEYYNPQEFTAAHRTLPFGTKIRVTNLENGKQAVVRVNDRGPFIDGRIIDLSKSAAKFLGFLEKGIVKVQIEVIY